MVCVEVAFLCPPHPGEMPGPGDAESEWCPALSFSVHLGHQRVCARWSPGLTMSQSGRAWVFRRSAVRDIDAQVTQLKWLHPREGSRSGHELGVCSGRGSGLSAMSSAVSWRREAMPPARHSPQGPCSWGRGASLMCPIFLSGGPSPLAAPQKGPSVSLDRVPGPNLAACACRAEPVLFSEPSGPRLDNPQGLCVTPGSSIPTYPHRRAAAAACSAHLHPSYSGG